MVTFLPFKGYRPQLRPGESISDRISPPYDVIGEEALKELQSKTENVTNLTLSPDPDRRYGTARALFDRMVEDGSLKCDSPSFYIYDQTFKDGDKEYTRRGFVGILKTEDYSEGNIMPHEETFSKVKADRLNLLRDMEVHLESIFGIFPGLGKDLNAKVDAQARLVYRYVSSDGVEHRYSRIEDPGLCDEISAAVEGEKMLIADGHHRFETALAYAKENPDVPEKQFVLCTMVAADDPGLVVWPTHRLIDAEDIGEKTAIRKIEKKMKCVEVDREEMLAQLPEHLFGMTFRTGRCLLVDNPDDISDPLMGLDTYSAQENILYGIYKSDEGKSKVSFDAEMDSALKTIDDKKHDAAVILNPPKLSTIWDFAEQGRRMPKKTTFFFPKIWSGWVFYKMNRSRRSRGRSAVAAPDPNIPADRRVLFFFLQKSTQDSPYRRSFPT